MSNTIHEFHFTIYPRRLWIVKNVKDSFIIDKFTERCGETIVIEREAGSEAACTTFPNVILKETAKYGYLVQIGSNASVADIAHEAGHVVTELFSEIGAFLSPNNQEPFCYALGFVVDCLNQVLTNRFKK